MIRKILLLSALLIVSLLQGFTQGQTASVNIDADIKFQKVTGYGGFVCAPTFNYNHMTIPEIERLWGKSSEMGYNIMRLYIPIGRDAWEQSLATAKHAQSLGLIIFASPWSMPAEWKTNNSISGVVINGTEENEGFLKEENYEDYANYLNDYATYLRDNGVELAGISLQNEPDYKVEYAGCTWTPQQIINFINNYGDIINCPIIAPETVGFSNNYIKPIVESEAFDKIAIYAGHQYGNIQSDIQKVYATGKEIWMTENLINWNAGLETPRNYSWELDAFDFSKSVNTAMLSNVSAWIHYASKRYYAMMGDGTNGTTAGAITKRGYILSHYAKYTTGTTRIEAQWKDESNMLEGSSFLSVSGDTVVLQVINPSNEPYELTVDLPFYTTSVTTIVTTDQQSMSSSAISLEDETFRPKMNVSASSFSTFVFVKSKERSESQMVGEPLNFNKIEDQTVTNAAFGTSYQLSGNSATFDVTTQLISPYQNVSSGYIELDEKFTKMIFHINSASSANQYNSDNTTLYYVNASGETSSHNYGKIDVFQTGDFDWEFDISSAVLTDGCTGIIGFSNTNYSSVLTIEFGDVYFKRGNEKAFKFSGIYSDDDSNLLDCLEDIGYTSLDFTEVTGITSAQDWHADAANVNCVFYVADDTDNSRSNVVKNNTCMNLALSEEGGDFYVSDSFTANAASYSHTFDNYGMLVLPFDAAIPADAKVYTLQTTNTEVTCTLIANNEIPANTPILVVGDGLIKFEGNGNVSSPLSIVNGLAGVYTQKRISTGAYFLKTQNGVAGFYRVNDGDEVFMEPFSAYYSEENGATVSSLPLKFPGEASVTVSFDVDGGSDVEAITVDFFGSVSEPSDPTKSEYVFTGWYKDPGFMTIWDFANDVVTEDITLYAKWQIANYTVSFDTDGGSSVAAVAAVSQGTIAAPEAPLKSGYVFAGWYKDSDFVDIWDFDNDIIAGNITLYAKWELITAVQPADGIRIHPSLVEDDLHLDFQDAWGYIYNLQGALVMDKFKVSGETTIDASSLVPGVYIVKVVTMAQIRTGKFIKQ